MSPFATHASPAPFAWPASLTGPPPVPRALSVDTIGFTAPTTIYEKMRGIQANAASLDAEIKNNLSPSSDYYVAWSNWYPNWYAFYSRYAGPDASETAKLAAAFYSDSIDRQTESHRAQYNSFRNSYNQQTRPDGRPVTPTVVPESRSGAPSSPSFGLPWWFWVAGGAALVGVGYLAYLKAHELTAKRRAIETRILPKIIGSDLAEAASARDHGCACRHETPRRDGEPEVRVRRRVRP